MVASGFLLTWNQAVPTNESLRMLLKQVGTAEPGSLQYEKLMEKCREHPELQREWAAFRILLADTLPGAGNISEVSACMEVSHKGETPRWHLHAMVSNQYPDVGKDSQLVTLHMYRLSFQGY